MNPKTPINPPFKFRILVSPGEEISPEQQREDAQHWLAGQREMLFAEWAAANSSETLDAGATELKKWGLLLAAFPTAQSRRIMFTVFYAASLRPYPPSSAEQTS